MNALIIIFYRIAAFFTRVPRKTTEKHTIERADKLMDSSFEDGKFINRQSEFSLVPYGRGNIGDNGCGPIAVYNALLALNSNKIATPLNTNSDIVPFKSVIDTFERKGATLNGRFGTSPNAIKRFLKLKGYSTKACMSKKSSKLNSFANDYDTFISIIYNNAERMRDGLHFICTVKSLKDDPLDSPLAHETGYMYTTYNPNRSSDNLYDALEKCSTDNIRHIYTIGIKLK